MSARIAVILGLLAITAPITAVTAAVDCLEPVGRWPFGVSNDVAAEGDVAVLANGAALQVLDLTAPSAPVLVGEVYLPTEILAVALSGTMAYALTNGNLHVIDLGGTAPTEVGALSGLGWGYGLDVEDGFAYIISHLRLSIVDVADPASPTLEGELVWTDGSPGDIEVVSSHAFVTAGSLGLRVVDVADPASPVEIAELGLGNDANTQRLDVVGGLAYVVGHEGPGIVDRLFVIDIADPAQPELLASPTVGGSRDIVVRQGLAVIADDWYLNTYDVTDPQLPMHLGDVQFASSYGRVNDHRLAAVDEFALLADEIHGLRIFDVSDPSAPTQEVVVGAPGQIEDAASGDGVLAIAAGDRGFRMVDVSDAARPVELGFTTNLGQPQVWGVAIEGDTAYALSYGVTGLLVLDISNPAAPVTLGNAPDVVGDWITIADHHAYVVISWIGRVFVVDLSSPSMPVLMGTLELGSGSWGWPVVVGEHLVVRNDDFADQSVVVIDVSDPTAPVQVAEIDVMANWAGLAATGSWLLVPDVIDIDSLEPAIRVFDMSDPSVPVEIAPYHPVGGAVGEIGVAGSVAYLAVMDAPPTQDGSIEVVNFASPQAPVFMDLLPRPGQIKRFAFSSQEIFVFDREAGFDTYALCQGPLFADGFETGDTQMWSTVNTTNGDWGGR